MMCIISDDNETHHNIYGRSKQLDLLNLCKKTGYTIRQENGQRRYGGPPPKWSGSIPGRGCEVSIG